MAIVHDFELDVRVRHALSFDTTKQQVDKLQKRINLTFFAFMQT